MTFTVLLAAFAIVTSGMSGYQGDVMVRGVVTDAQSGRGVAGAVVYALSDTDLQRRVTDERGRFIFFALLPGYYSFYAQKTGYDDRCSSPFGRGRELEAGLEYDATVWLPKSCRALTFPAPSRNPQSAGRGR